MIWRPLLLCLGLLAATAGCRRATVAEVGAQERPLAGARATSQASERAAAASPMVPSAAAAGAPLKQAPLPR